MDWELYAWLKRGPRRLSVLEALSETGKPLSVKDVKTKLGVALAQASITIKELSEKALIECLNPSDSIGKLYRVSKLGNELIEEIKK